MNVEIPINVDTPLTVNPVECKVFEPTWTPLVWCIVTPDPTLTWLLEPSIVTDELPIVRIPVTLAFPVTISWVVAPPTTVLP